MRRHRSGALEAETPRTSNTRRHRRSSFFGSSPSASDSTKVNHEDEDFVSEEEREFHVDDGPEETSRPLSWRLDPYNSMSDWTVMLTDAGNKTIALYHVHQNIVGVGPHKSRYFEKIFRNAALVGNHCEISLGQSAASAFPLMLDFIYSNGGTEFQFQFKTAHVVALRYLGRRFGVKSLHGAATSYIRDTMSYMTAPIYLAEAGAYEDDRLVEACIAVCADNFERIYSDVLASLPPDLFRRTIESPNLQCRPECMSKVVAKFCRIQGECIDTDFLRAITSPKLLPTVEPKDAPFLLRYSTEKQLDAFESSDFWREYIDEGPTLTRRCIDAIGKSWNDQTVLSLERTRSRGFRSFSLSSSTRSLTNTTSVASSRMQSLSVQTDHLGQEEMTRNSIQSNLSQSCESNEDLDTALHHQYLPQSIQINLLEAALGNARSDRILASQTKSTLAEASVSSRDKEIQLLMDTIEEKNKEIKCLEQTVRSLQATDKYERKWRKRRVSM